ncbi:MAG: 4-hydroxythreonine-4-phosphate dehydrogenase PdxA [Proteobacteria bacterium]|nr:4-hydroxythreonine-4-phosphate dehydrogenase PdxA [Pseudomonadota bacterium]
MPLPTIGITMGDPVGIGPEIIVKALAQEEVFAYCRPLVFGDANVLSEANRALNTPCKINAVRGVEEAKGTPGTIDLIELSRTDLNGFRFGTPKKSYAGQIMRYLETALSFAMDGRINGMTTCPINKGFLNDAGYPFTGHTEFLAQRTKSAPVVMMLATPRLKVALVTTHCPLRDVPGLITQEGIMDTIRITDSALRSSFGIPNPQLAVASLNPHAGEDGLFGDEEKTSILPAIHGCRRAGVNVVGPLASDSLFHFAVEGIYDAVVCMYHDQGLIPIKLMGFTKAVNVTLGLSIIRTSVDHGTAYDIAGSGVADPSSLIEAIIVASKMAR